MSETPLSAATADVPPTAMPWVLLEAFDGPHCFRVIVEGEQPRHRTRWERSRIGGSRAVTHRLPEAVGLALTTGRQHTLSVHRQPGDPMRVIAIPITIGGATVATQVWAGAVDTPIPPRPVIGTAHWRAGSCGIATTSATLERMLDSDRTTDTRRTMSDLMGHFDDIEDRGGLLELFDVAAPPRHWMGAAVTSGRSTGARHTLLLAAHSSVQGPRRMVRAVAVDISATRPPPPPPVPIRLLRELPVRHGHGIAVMDLRSGLIHEWIHPGPAPLHRWLGENPEIEESDRPGLARLRAHLINGLDHARTTLQLRFGSANDWVAVQATWVVLTRGAAPQAMVDVTLPERIRRADRGRPRPVDRP